MIGAVIIGVLNNGLNLLNVSSFYQQVVKGAVILIAVLLDRSKTRTAKSAKLNEKEPGKMKKMVS